MDTHKFGKGTSWEHRKLVKNSVISVTIDDLREGLVVVSFSHEDKLYQGVLLQLNRERGIPSGISFPKDYFSGSDPEQQGSVAGIENDPTQIAALPQRHTYFQDKEGTSASTTVTASSASSDSTGLRSRVGLRKFIKPPARYKNSRMSLRLRNRPVLCAKCRAFCEEKGGLKPIDKKKKKNEEETEGEVSKKVSGVTTRNRGKSGVETTSITSVSESTAAATTTTTASTTCIDNEPPQDYSFVSFGTQEFIENYWKRPSLLPEPEKPKKPDKPSYYGESTMVFAKTVPKLAKLNFASLQVNGKESNNSLATKDYEDKKFSDAASTIDKTIAKINRKSKSLKICVTKLAKPSSLSSSSLTTTVDSRSISPSTPPPKGSSPEKNLNSSVDIGNIDILKSNHEGISESSSLSDVTLDCPDALMKEDMGTSTKMWENRIRKTSVVPARFRDELYVTKKVFGFKRRRRGDDEDIEDVEGSELNGVELDEFSKNKTVDLDFNKLSPTTAEVASSSSSAASDTSTPNITTTTISNVGASCSTVVNGHNIVSEGKSVPAKAKTPVIKISFSTPSNGVVISTIKAQQDEPLSEKAARRAMKKAKKEAKRKCSSTSSPPPPTIKYASTSSSSMSLNSHSQTPSPPTLNPEYPVFANCDEFDSMNPPSLSGSMEPMEPLNKTPKKKKKEKKRKRHKGGVPKENDVHINIATLYQNKQSCTITGPPSKIQKLNSDVFSSSPSSPVFVQDYISPPSSSTDTLPLVPYSVVPNQYPTTQHNVLPTQEPLLQNKDHSSVMGGHHSDDDDDLLEDEMLLFNVGEPGDNPSTREEIDSSSSSAEPPQRVCISLKRLCENSYVSWDKSQGLNNHDELSSIEQEQVVSPPAPDSEINDYPMNDPLSNDHQEVNADSLLTYTDESNSYVYRKDDIIWGKLPGCVWWPAKILDILCVNATDVTARVSWFRASTLSRIRFSQLRPFADHFDARYARSRKRGSYQLAVRDALIEAHQLDQNGAKQLYPND